MAAEKVNLAAYGQVGFPRFLPPVAGKGGFPLKETSAGRPCRDLIALKNTALQSLFCITQASPEG